MWEQLSSVFVNAVPSSAAQLLVRRSVSFLGCPVRAELRGRLPTLRSGKTTVTTVKVAHYG